MDYEKFLKKKLIISPPCGLTAAPKIPNACFEFQKDIIKWALWRGRACVWADCGLGKTLMQLTWCANIPGDTLILAPLGVTHQTVAEGERFGIPVHYCRAQEDVEPGITITNYQMLHKFDLSKFMGLALDESSILKSFEGHFRNAIINGSRDIPYRSAYTATPAPNDFMELGNHAEFLGVMTRSEMLSMFFVHDGSDTSKWRLKGHAQDDFWKWVASWAVLIRQPSDLGYKDEGFILPPINSTELIVESKNNGEFLFPMEARTLQERLHAKRDSIDDRIKIAYETIKGKPEQFLIWCNLNAEQDKLAKLLGDNCVSISGATPDWKKVDLCRSWLRGEVGCLISKVRIFGYGMNFQHCWNELFLGLNDSWEQYYQAVRRIWRFGQKKPVNIFIVASSAEGAVLSNIKRKEGDAHKMADEMLVHMKEINRKEIHGATGTTQDEYKPNILMTLPPWAGGIRQDVKVCKQEFGKAFAAYQVDCVEGCKALLDESVGYSVYSVPFASLYTYSASNRDMGNCKTYSEFAEHLRFLARELFRVTKPGRMSSIHCMNLPTTITHHGQIGIQDFRGDLIRMFEAEGFIYHSEACIWKDPVTAMQRTHAIGLLYKQLRKDSCMSRMGIPDYVVTMRKPGENTIPVEHCPEDFPVETWQKWASPIWRDIDPGDTLQFRSVREHKDEKHICPLQLEVIRRCLRLWSAKDDVVLSPFMGIGSEGYEAVKLGRKFIGFELKKSYARQAAQNLMVAEQELGEQDLFGRQSSPGASVVPAIPQTDAANASSSPSGEVSCNHAPPGGASLPIDYDKTTPTNDGQSPDAPDRKPAKKRSRRRKADAGRANASLPLG